jgi:DNA invertase Pin-like site-specific DNA recombinase
MGLDMSHGKLLGYVRVSTFEQNPGRQLEGQTLHKTFIDKISGKSRHRPQLNALLDYAREGDTILVHSMDRLARNLDDLRKLVIYELVPKKITVKFLKENLTFSGKTDPMSKLMLSVMGSFAEFERALLRERQLEGIALAKQRGAYKGRKKVLTPEKIENLKVLLKKKVSKTKIANTLGISRETLYKYLKNKNL